jgi:hypothetical protein
VEVKEFEYAHGDGDGMVVWELWKFLTFAASLASRKWKIFLSYRYFDNMAKIV